MTKTTGTHLTRQQVVQLGIILQAKCKPAKDGYYEYVDGYSDARIAGDNDVKTSKVTKLRKDLLGDLMPGGPMQNPLHHAWVRIKDMERRTEALERRVEALEEAATSADKDAKQSPYKFATRPNGL